MIEFRAREDAGNSTERMMDEKARHGEVILVEDMPLVDKAAGKGRQVDAVTLGSILDRAHTNSCHAWVENVHAMPKQGVSSTFSFGVGFGILLGCLGGLRSPYTFVVTGFWKRKMGITGKGKDASRSRSLQLFPALAEQLRYKCHHGRAVALLISRYGDHSLESI